MTRYPTLLVLLSVSGASPTAAQPCTPEWLPGQGLPGVGDAGHVAAIKQWDPDGSGPQTPLWVAGGNFKVAGNTVAHNIAAWNGSNWQALGTGVGMPGGGSVQGVRALEVYHDELVAAGWFYEAGGAPANSIARWNGASWQPLGLGAGEAVGALMTYQSDLIAGGGFSVAGGAPGNGIARWDGASWHPLGPGMTGPTSEDSVYALAGYGGDLIAAGSFDLAGGILCNAIARWDGAEWHPLGTGITSQYGYVLALAVYNGELIAAGRFSTAGGTPTNNIARWNGATWQPLGSGIEYGEANDLCVHRGRLIAGGDFLRAGGQPANDLAAWNGVSWQQFGGGVTGLYSELYALAAAGDQLLAGGDFFAIGGVSALDIASWDGRGWQAMGYTGPSSPALQEFQSYKGDLLAAGYFEGGFAIGRWKGDSWRTLSSVGGTVAALEPYGDKLVAGGLFQSVGGQTAKNIAEWDGTSWSPVGPGLESQVTALALHGEQLAAGVRVASWPWTHSVVVWDGASWSGVGNAFVYFAGQFQLPYLATVFDLAPFGQDLVAGGDFTAVGTVNARGIAIWQNGSWHELGGGVLGVVDELEVYNAELIAAGHFSLVGGTLIRALARWDGVQWRPIGTGLQGCQGSNCQTKVNALVVSGGDLLIAGNFRGAGATDANRIARWDGGSWHAFGLGIGAPFDAGSVAALGAHNGEVFATGYFLTAGEHVSVSYARWACPSCYPDCNEDLQLSIADFDCFQSKFAAQDPYADCNQSTTFTIADFGCFQSRFAAGCP